MAGSGRSDGVDRRRSEDGEFGDGAASDAFGARAAGARIPADMVVVVSEGAKDFHRPGCDVIHNKDKERTLTANEAIREGYVPCVRCLRKYLETASKGRTMLESEATRVDRGRREGILVGQ